MSSQTVTLTIEVPQAELTLLGELLKVGSERTKDPVRFVARTALNNALAKANSTVAVRDWRHIDHLARKLNLAPVFLQDWRTVPRKARWSDR
jgi:hypothetical protein